MKRNRAADISLMFVIAFVVISFAVGAKQYNHTQEMIIANLNQALREAAKEHANNWLCRDTIQSYARLQKQMGMAVTLHAYDDVFIKALPEKRFKRNAGIQISVLRMDTHGVREETVADNDEGFIMSDTLILVNSAKVADAALSLRGYVYCPFVNVLKMTDMTVPVILFVMALCFSGLFFYLKQTDNPIVPHLITFGDLSFCTDDNCIYDLDSHRLSLTPMEFRLLEMFYRSSSHFLLKKDICDSLWPGKDNADETLYALVRRLKQTLAEHSRMKISAVRGRAYQLETL